MASKGQKHRRYDQSVKEIIVNQVLNNHRSYSDLAKEYQIPMGTIISWVYHYRQRGEITKDKLGRPTPGTEVDYKEKYEILKKFMSFCEKVDRKKK